jgi:putative PIN family toxin of toxin-antitoxin system
MRVVLDTNVLVSAALKDKSLPAIAVRLAACHSILLKSAATEAQFLEVVSRPYLAPLIAPASREWLTNLLAGAEFVSITDRVAVCRDPTDDKFLEVAVNGLADLILTGDNDLLVLNPFRGIPIVAPAAFVQGATRP